MGRRGEAVGAGGGGERRRARAEAALSFFPFFPVREVDEGEERGIDLTAVHVHIQRLWPDRPKVWAGPPAPITGLFTLYILH